MTVTIKCLLVMIMSCCLSFWKVERGGIACRFPRKSQSCDLHMHIPFWNKSIFSIDWFWQDSIDCISYSLFPASRLRDEAFSQYGVVTACRCLAMKLVLCHTYPAKNHLGDGKPQRFVVPPHSPWTDRVSMARSVEPRNQGVFVGGSRTSGA